MIVAGLLLSGTVTAIFYVVFYAISPWTYSFTTPFSPGDLTVWARCPFADPRDGIEVYVAFVMIFLMMSTAVVSFWLYSKISGILWRRTLLVVMTGICGIYLHAISFSPPGASARFDDQAFLATLLICSGTFILGYCFPKNRWTGYALATTFLLLCAFPPVWFFNSNDYFYLLAPALRTSQGAPLDQTSFQYDHLISFVGMMWMKLRLPIEKFHVVGNMTYFGLLIGIYYLARQLFIDKSLAVYCAVSLAIIKLYGGMSDITHFPQVAPLRLDWWLPILALVYLKKPNHWSVGLLLGGLMIFHHTFGTIYALCYFLAVCLLLVWKVIDATDRTWLGTWNTGKSYARNLFIVALGAIIYRLIMQCEVSAAEIYQKYQIGFLPIDKHSFFWYLPMVFIIAALLLWNMRQYLPAPYVQTGTCLVFFGIGNLIYFFGRSHDNNLINIAGSEWLLLFFVFDILLIRVRKRGTWIGQRWVVSLVAVVIIGAISHTYSASLVDRFKAQIANAKDIFSPPSELQNTRCFLRAVTVETKGNQKIIFLSERFDFILYYYGQYNIADPYALAGRHLFKKEYTDFLNLKLSQGYALIVPNCELFLFVDIIKGLKATCCKQNPLFVLISNS